MKNVTVSIGSVGLIDKINDKLDFFDHVFGKTGGRARFFKESAKLFVPIVWENVLESTD